MPQQSALTRASVINGSTALLSISRGAAYCSGDVTGDSSTTTVVIFLYLKKFESGNFQKKYNQSQSFSDSEGYLEFEKSLTTYGSGPYRLDGSYYLFTDSKCINPESSSAVWYY